MTKTPSGAGGFVMLTESPAVETTQPDVGGVRDASMKQPAAVPLGCSESTIPSAGMRSTCPGN